MQKLLRSSFRVLALTALGLSVADAVAAAQTDSTPARPQGTPQPTVDSTAFDRARQMVLDGNAVAGRALADSLVQAVPEGTPAFGDALYWRATIAATAADAERDYRRIIIEYALAPHAGDALLALAQLEMSRGDRVSATSHLQRFLLEFPQRSDRPRAGLWLGRLLLEQNAVPKACAVLRDADASVPAEQVELKNQIEYYTPRCMGVDTTSVSAVSTAAPSPAGSATRSAPTTDSAHGGAPGQPAAPPAGGATASAKTSATSTTTNTSRPVAPAGSTTTSAGAPVASSAPRHVAKREAAPASAQWTVQVAAYQTEADAQALVSKLKAHDYDAYVVRAARIYRVRLGHLATREDALALLASLRQRGMSGFVTTADAQAP